jgi:hypothetical protein
MNIQNNIINIKHRKVANDTIYTPKPIALKLIEMCDLKAGDTVLDSSYGGGVFYENFPDYVSKDWCEIEKGRDFFEYNQNVDCIISNPPFSLFNKWVEHTTKLTDKIGLVLGMCCLTPKRLNILLSQGFFMTKLHICDINWWFGHSYLVVFEKNKNNTPLSLTVDIKPINCDICGKNCKRGRQGNNPNICTNIPI